MKVGELLLHHDLVDWETLALAINDQPGSGMRLCSFLVARGKLDFDDASRVLGEQLGTAAVLRRHLERRDRSLAPMLPRELAQARVALPIGRLANGSYIVCVRDPSPKLHTLISRTLLEPVVLAVAPARYIERLVADTYAQKSDAEILVLDADLVDDDDDEDDAVGFELDIDVDVERPPADAPGSSLDDDFAIDIETEPARPANRALPVVFKPVAHAKGAAPARDSLDATLAAFKDIDEVDWLFDVAMQYLTTHWSASLLVELRDARAVGVRGHGKRLGPGAVRTFVVTIEDAAIIRAARDERRVIDGAPEEAGSEHAELLAALDATTSPIAAPLLRRDAVSHVLILGEPVGGDRDEALVDVGLLVETMGDALSRM